MTNSVTATKHLLRTRSRYAANALFDALTDPRPRDGSDVPWRAEAMTSAWLTANICSQVPGAAVTNVIVDGGHEGSSIRRKITVEYNAAGVDAGLPVHLFAKSSPTWLTRLASSAEIARAESEFLRQKAHLDIETPTLAYGAVDRATGRMIELFVDLVAESGAVFFDWTTTIDRRQADQVADTLGVLHGSLAAEVAAGKFSWLPVYGGRITRGDQNGLLNAHETALDRCGDLLPTTLLAERDRIWPAVLRNVRVDAGRAQTVIHSDVHLGNWYETASGRIGLADWQCVSVGHWARDVAYAFSTLLAVDDRRAWERDLFDRYLDVVQSRSGMRIAVDSAWCDYRRYLVNALLSWTPTLVPTTTMPDMQPLEMSTLMLKRIGSAIVDLDALDACEMSGVA